jgi:hypothetical protein
MGVDGGDGHMVTEVLLAVGPVDLDDLETSSGEKPGQSGPIGTRPLHSDLPDLPLAG